MAPLEENCHKYGTSKQTFYRWKTKYGGLSAIEVRRLRQLEEENRKLSKIVAERLLSRLAGGEYGMEFLNTEAKRRQGQRLFAYYVLHNFSGWCSFCAIGARPLLEAAHIKPVREFPEIGMDPLNGVALCRNHHRAWDEGILRWCGGEVAVGLGADGEPERLQGLLDPLLLAPRAPRHPLRADALEWRKDQSE